MFLSLLKQYRTLLLVGILTLCYQPVFADNPPSPSTKAPDQVPIVAQVVWVKGEVKAILPNKNTRLLKRRDYVYEHDTLVTTTTGSGEIAFTDSTLLTIKNDTTLKIDAYKYNQGKDPKDENYSVGLVKGGFRTITGVIAKSNPAHYKVNTPVATIGVRGTQFNVCYGCLPSHANQLIVQIDRGVVSTTNQTGTSVITPGQQSVAVFNSQKEKAILSNQVPTQYQILLKNIPHVVTAPPPAPAMTSPPVGAPPSATQNNTNAGAAAGAAGGTGGGGTSGGTSGGSSTSTGGSSTSSGGASTSSAGSSSGTTVGGSTSTSGSSTTGTSTGTGIGTGGSTGSKTINSFCIN